MEIQTSFAPAEIQLEVVDAHEEMRQPVVGVGGAQEDQGQERLAL